VWLGLDRTTENAPLPVDWKERANTIKKLIDAGWGHRIRARPQQAHPFRHFWLVKEFKEGCSCLPWRSLRGQLLS